MRREEAHAMYKDVIDAKRYVKQREISPSSSGHHPYESTLSIHFPTFYQDHLLRARQVFFKQEEDSIEHSKPIHESLLYGVCAERTGRR
jgi:hypothetical protein